MLSTKNNKIPATPKEQLTDDQLVAYAQQNDQEAFTILYQRYLPIVYRHVRQTMPEPDVEDMTQDIFIHILKALPTFQQRSKFSTWIYTLTRRRIADYYRHRGRQQDLKNVTLSQAEQQYDTTSTNHDDSWQLRQSLATLPEHYQEVIILRFIHGLQFKEIAQTQGQNIEATKSLFRRAISALRSEMSTNNV